MSQQRRFIAGAVCPSCQEMDKLFFYEVESLKIRECVRCGFKEEINPQGEIRELVTPVNGLQQNKDAQADGLQVIDIKPL